MVQPICPQCRVPGKEGDICRRHVNYTVIDWPDVYTDTVREERWFKTTARNRAGMPLYRREGDVEGT